MGIITPSGGARRQLTKDEKEAIFPILDDIAKNYNIAKNNIIIVNDNGLGIVKNDKETSGTSSQLFVILIIQMI